MGADRDKAGDKARANRARAQLTAMLLFEEASALETRAARIGHVAGAALPLAVRRMALAMLALESDARGALEDPLRALITESREGPG